MNFAILNGSSFWNKNIKAIQRGLFFYLLCFLHVETIAQVEDGSLSSGVLQTSIFNPACEFITWDGKNWDIAICRIFRMRFEQYLIAPESSLKDNQEYNHILQDITYLLSKNRLTPKTFNEALKLLIEASEFPFDANHCEDIANQIYLSNLTKRKSENFSFINAALEKERKQLEWNAKFETNAKKRNSSINYDIQMHSIRARLAEIHSTIAVNRLKQKASLIQSKIDFQTLILSLFFQRRFQHVTVAISFYRSIFTDGDNQLYVGAKCWNLFSNAAGMTPTIETIQTVTNQIMYDAEETMNSFHYLLDHNELKGASQRLSEAFIAGEYLPALRTLPLGKKCRIWIFDQKANSLGSALENKNYIVAEKLVNDLRRSARDFDNSKAVNAIEMAKNLSVLHLEKAKRAAISGNNHILDTEFKAAVHIWPLNPALKEILENSGD